MIVSCQPEVSPPSESGVSGFFQHIGDVVSGIGSALDSFPEVFDALT